jgi:hypothetical protein
MTEFFPSSFATIQPGPGTLVLGYMGSGPVNVDMTYVALNSVSTLEALGTTQSTAASLISSYTVITNSSLNSGVVLPTPVTSTVITVINRSNTAISVYPGLGSSIESQGANNPILLNAGSSNILAYTGDNQWYVL